MNRMKLKQIIFFILNIILLSGILILNSCKKETIVGNPGTDPTEPFNYGVVSMVVDGEVWKSDSSSNLIVISNGIFTLQAFGEGNSIVLNIDSFGGPGQVYLIDHQGNFGIYNSASDSVSYYDGEDGSILVSDVNSDEHRINGSFEINANNLVDPSLEADISEGILIDVPVWYVTNQVNDAITFNVDGIQYTPDIVTVNSIPYDKSITIDYVDIDGFEDGYLRFPFDIEPGIYDYSNDNLGPIYFWYNFMSPNSGNLVITLNDKENRHVEGVFDLEVVNLINLATSDIASGQFSIYY